MKRPTERAAVPTTTRAAIVLALVLGLVGCSPSGPGGTGAPSEPPSAAPSAPVDEGPSVEPSEPGPSPFPSPSEPAPRLVDLDAELEALEEEFDATVGVSALDTATGDRVEFRAEERFGFAST